ncbi:MAG TPA: hypothetical protein VLC46_20225 [Thermoanaerobaculia bacterium]|jgi:hypothetical protein|nr:hypothetical protein [Thermoanaerobaculia bacterium]
MSETNQTDTSKTPPATEEEASTYLLYPLEEEGPGTFVMHGVNLFFRRGAITGPVTATVAEIVTGRGKNPAIRIATADEIKAAAVPSTVGLSAPATKEDKTDDKTGDKTDTTKNDDTKGSATTGTTTGPSDTTPGDTAQTARGKKPGTTLTVG